MSLAVTSNLALLTPKPPTSAGASLANGRTSQVASDLKAGAAAPGASGTALGDAIAYFQQRSLAPTQTSNTAQAMRQAAQVALDQISGLWTEIGRVATTNAQPGVDAATQAVGKGLINDAVASISSLLYTTASYGANLVTNPSSGSSETQSLWTAYAVQASKDIDALAKTDFSKASDSAQALAVIDREIARTATAKDSFGDYSTSAVPASLTTPSQAASADNQIGVVTRQQLASFTQPFATPSASSAQSLLALLQG